MTRTQAYEYGYNYANRAMGGESAASAYAAMILSDAYAEHQEATRKRNRELANRDNVSRKGTRAMMRGA